MSALAAVTVPATTANLGPGFDAFGAALTLRLAVVATASTDDGQRVVMTGEGAGEVSSGDDNLVWSSLLAACERFGWAVPDVTLHVDNPIPLARGMGSSSAAIVGGLAIARVLAGADGSVAAERAVAVGDVALTRLADELEGHPDNVAPAVHGGLVACAPTDDGETVVRLLPPPATTRPVVFVPVTRALTSEARGVVPEALGRADVAIQAARAGHVLAGMAGLFPVDARLAGDRLHEPARAAVMRPSSVLLDALRADGVHAWLSGAGPSVAAAVSRRAVGEDAVIAHAEAAGFATMRLDWDRQGIRSCTLEVCGVAGGKRCPDCPLRRLQ